MLIVSQNLVLSQVAEFPAWSPVVGWHNLVTAETVTADTEDPLFPAVNLATVLTPERWQAADTTEQRILVDLSGYIGEVDYIAVAKHNFGSAGIEVSVEGYSEVDEFGAPDWVELVEGAVLPDDSAAIFRFTPDALLGICLRLKTGTAPGRAAVLYVGKLLVLKPSIQTEFTPLSYGRVTDVMTDIAEFGDYLGRIVLRRSQRSSVRLLYLDPAWYRSQMDPFIAASATTPFFFAWNPLDYPRETGFAWIRQGSDPQPAIYENIGLMSIDLQMDGIA